MLSNEPEMPQLIALYAMVSRMHVLSPLQTVASAERIMGKMILRVVPSGFGLPREKIDRAE
jgi:hypothetical protein